MPVREDYFYSMVSPSEEIQASLGRNFWIPLCGFQITGTGLDSFSVELGFRIPIASGIPDFTELYSRFQIPGFRIPWAKISRTPDSLTCCDNGTP